MLKYFTKLRNFNRIKKLHKQAIEVLEATSIDMNIKKIQKKASKSFREHLQGQTKYTTLESSYFDYVALKEHKEYLLVLEEEGKLGKLFCWHSWIFLGTNFTLGDKFQCKKCQKIKYDD